MSDIQPDPPVVTTTSTSTQTVTAPPAQPTVRDYLPETRTWIMFGLFALAFYVIHELVRVPSLQDNKLFFGLATLIVGTFFGGAIGFYFGASQGKKDPTLPSP